MPGDPWGVGTSTPERPASNTSLLPIQADTKVGLGWRARCTCDLPPRTNVVSAFDATVVLLTGSSTRAPGTATLFRMSVTEADALTAHVVLVPPATRAPVWVLAIGGGQPGMFSDA